MAIESILPSDSGKVAFEKTSRNFELMDDKINVLSEYKNMGSVSAVNPNSNYKTGLFNVGTPIDGKYFYVTKIKYPDLGDGYYKLIAYGFDASDNKVKDSIWTGRIHAGQFTGWVEYATTEQINVLSTDRGYTSSRTLSNDIDVNTIKDNGKYYNRALINSPVDSNGSWGSIDVTQANTSIYTHLYHYPEIEKSFLKYIYNSKIVTKEIATTTKTDILCTSGTGFKITRQNCWIENNYMYINVDVMRTSETAFDINQSLNLINLPRRPKTTTVIQAECHQTGAPARYLCGAIAHDNTGLYITVQNSGCTYVTVSGVIAI